jgi:hypothetical protein
MNASIMTTGQFPDLLRVGIREVFLSEYQSYPELYSKVYDVQTSNRAYEEELIIAGFGAVPEWNSDGSELPTDRALTGNRVLYVHKDYGMMWTVSKRLLREDLYAKIGGELMREAVRAMKHTVELVAWSVIANSFQTPSSTRFLFGDHTLLNGERFENRLTVALSATGLEQALTRFHRWKNHRGIPVVIQPQLLVVPPELKYVAHTLLHSTYYPNIGTSGNTAPSATGAAFYDNPFKNVIPDMLVVPYLSDTNDWFIFAKPKVHKLRFYWREKPATDMFTDFRTKGVMHSITAAFSVGYTDFYGTLGSSVS